MNKTKAMATLDYMIEHHLIDKQSVNVYKAIIKDHGIDKLSSVNEFEKLAKWIEQRKGESK